MRAAGGLENVITREDKGRVEWDRVALPTKTAADN